MGDLKRRDWWKREYKSELSGKIVQMTQEHMIKRSRVKIIQELGYIEGTARSLRLDEGDYLLPKETDWELLEKTENDLHEIVEQLTELAHKFNRRYLVLIEK